MLPKKYREKDAKNNRTEILSEKLPLEALVKNIRTSMLS